MISNEPKIKVGTVSKTHALKGEVVLVFDYDAKDVLGAIKVFFLGKNNKVANPYFVIKNSFNENGAIFSFEDIITVDKARSIVGLDVFLPESSLGKLADMIWAFDELIGFSIIDKNQGELGVVADYYESTGQDLLSFTHKGKEVLLPLHEHIVEKILRTKKQLLVNLPDGLLQIYLDLPGPKDDGFDEEEINEAE